MVFCCILRCFVAKSFVFCDLRCFSKNRFVAIYALLCGENFSPNNSDRGEKMTNIRYAPPPPPFLAESAPMMIVIRMRSLYTINDFLRIYVVPPDIKQKVILWKFCRGSLGMCSNKYNFQGWREGKSRGEGEVLSGARQQTPLSLLLRLLPKAAIGKLKM